MIKIHQLGFYGEEKAVKYLKKCKYIVLCRNYSTKQGEIDIIAIETIKSRKHEKNYKNNPFLFEDVLVFLEVKTRSSLCFGMPSQAVDIKKQKNYFAVSRSFINEFKLHNFQVRYDIVEVVNDKIYHIKNAF